MTWELKSLLERHSPGWRREGWISQERRSPGWRREDPSQGFLVPRREAERSLSNAEIMIRAELFQLSYGTLTSQARRLLCQRVSPADRYQDEHIRHRPSSVLKVNQARLPERVLTPLAPRVLAARNAGEAGPLLNLLLPPTSKLRVYPMKGASEHFHFLSVLAGT